MISFLPWFNSSSSSRWTWIYMHWTTAWCVNCGCLSHKHSASMFRWYDPLRSWPLHITVLWKSHLYSSQRCGMLWCLSAEKCTRLPSNAVMTHRHRQSARTTRALNVRDWPWLHIWKTHSKQNQVLVLRWPPDYPMIWDWFLFNKNETLYGHLLFFVLLLVRAAELLQVQTHRQSLNICSILPASIKRIYWSRYQRQKKTSNAI